MAKSAPRIVGGTVSAAGAWPWAVALETADGWQYCGGTLIRPEWVLTAGHCGVRVGERAVLGRLDLRLTDGETITVDRVLTHELFTGAENGFDVSLAHLSRAATETPAPTVPGGWSGVGVSSTAIGWGLTSEGASATSPILRQVSVPIWTNAACAGAYPGVPSTALCAGVAAGGKDTCQGDSGGGLFVELGSIGWAIAGITSYGDGCARPGLPGVYTAVSMVREWIGACAVGP